MERFGFRPFSDNYQEVHHVVVRNDDWQAGDPVSVAIESDVDGFSYATNGIFAGPDGAIHLWLPKGTHTLTVDGVEAEAVLNYSVTSLVIDVSTPEISFADWCAKYGLKPIPDAMTDGEPNILRYVFARRRGPLPMPTLDPTPMYPTVDIPPRKHEYPKARLAVLGTTDLALPVSKWKDFYEDPDIPDRWVWRRPGYPESLFVRYWITY